MDLQRQRRDGNKFSLPDERRNCIVERKVARVFFHADDPLRVDKFALNRDTGSSSSDKDHEESFRLRLVCWDSRTEHLCLASV